MENASQWHNTPIELGHKPTDLFKLHEASYFPHKSVVVRVDTKRSFWVYLGVQFKVLVLTINTLNVLGTDFLKDSVLLNESSHLLRFAGNDFLHVLPISGWLAHE